VVLDLFGRGHTDADFFQHRVCRREEPGGRLCFTARPGDARHGNNVLGYTSPVSGIDIILERFQGVCFRLIDIAAAPLDIAKVAQHQAPPLAVTQAVGNLHAAPVILPGLRMFSPQSKDLTYSYEHAANESQVARFLQQRDGLPAQLQCALVVATRIGYEAHVVHGRADAPLIVEPAPHSETFIVDLLGPVVIAMLQGYARQVMQRAGLSPVERPAQGQAEVVVLCLQSRQPLATLRPRRSVGSALSQSRRRRSCPR